LGFRNPVVFKNAIYFGRGNDLWKTDGTTAGTVFVTDSTNKIRGANADYLIAFYTTPIAVSPYQVYHFKRIDGTISSAISTNVGYGASFVVLNNKMYNYGTGDGLWSSDGTEAGSSQLATNISTNFHVFNGNLYYNAWTRTAPTGGNGWGYELWWLTPGATTAISSLNNEPIFQVYPNPVNTELHFTNYEVQSEQTVMIFDVNGKMIRNEKVISNRLDVSELANGFYVFALNTNGKTQQQKFIVQH